MLTYYRGQQRSTMNQSLGVSIAKNRTSDNASHTPDSRINIVATCFIQFHNTILVLKKSKSADQNFAWEVPECEIEPDKGSNELEFLSEKIFLLLRQKIRAEEFQFATRRYELKSGLDYVLHIYYLKLTVKPNVLLSEGCIEARWIPIHSYKTLGLADGQKKAFDTIFGTSIWQRNPTKINLTLIRANRSIEFSSSRRLVINLFGAPGSGKGTQGKMLSEIYDIPTISVGDLFRTELRNKTAVGRYMNYHDSVDPHSFFPDELYLGIMSKRLAEKDCQYGFILDGFPKTPVQALVLVNYFLRREDVHIPIFMDLNEEILKGRVPNRFICPSCGIQVRAHEKNTGYCPESSCHNAVLQNRMEDIDQEKLVRRIEFFSENRDGILNILGERDEVSHMQLKGNEPPDEVFETICKSIDKRLDSQPLQEGQKIIKFPAQLSLEKAQEKTKEEADPTLFISMYNSFSKNKGLLSAATVVGIGALIYYNKKPRI